MYLASINCCEIYFLLSANWVFLANIASHFLGCCTTSVTSEISASAFQWLGCVWKHIFVHIWSVCWTLSWWGIEKSYLTKAIPLQPQTGGGSRIKVHWFLQPPGHRLKCELWPQPTPTPPPISQPPCGYIQSDSTQTLATVRAFHNHGDIDIFFWIGIYYSFKTLYSKEDEQHSLNYLSSIQWFVCHCYILV